MSSSVVTSPATVWLVTISRSSRRMILPLRVFGSPSVNRISSGRAKAPISFATHCRNSCPSCVCSQSPLLQRYERADRLSRNLVRLADHRRFGDSGVTDQRRFDFHRAEPVPADIHHIVHSAEDPEVTVVVGLAPVASEVNARIRGTNIAAHTDAGSSWIVRIIARPGPLHNQKASRSGASTGFAV